LNDIFAQIRQERARQDKLHPNTDLTPAEWMNALGEEYGEVLKEVNHTRETGEPLRPNYITELIHVAATAVRIIEVYQQNALDKPITQEQPIISTQLRKCLDQIIALYVAEFEEKHKTQLEYWIADDTTGIAAFGDNFFNLSDIVYDIDNKCPAGKIFSWQDHQIESGSKVNFKSYLGGIR
jgi:NTP pyrophosphatase (non-canonical NTP hydrolase)